MMVEIITANGHRAYNLTGLVEAPGRSGSIDFSAAIGYHSCTQLSGKKNSPHSQKRLSLAR